MDNVNRCPTCEDGRLTVAHPTRCRECVAQAPNLVRTVADAFPGNVAVVYWAHLCHDAAGNPTPNR